MNNDQPQVKVSCDTNLFSTYSQISKNILLAHVILNDKNVRETSEHSLMSNVSELMDSSGDIYL